MKKSNFLFIQYVLLTTTILVGYTHCRCTSSSPQDISPSSSPADSDNNPAPPTTITQEMIDIVADSVKIEPRYQFLVDRLQELKNGDKTNIDKQDTFGDFTALHHAALLKNPSIVAALLKLGADPTIKDNIDKIPPFIITFGVNNNESLETAETFLNDSKVASFINLKDKKNYSPLTLIERKLQLLDLSKVTDYPKMKDLLIIREKMVSQGAKY